MAEDNTIRIDFPRGSSPRRLVAILMADIVGYSALTHRDELGTHNRVERLREDVILPAFREYHGTLRKQTGDGFLCTFESPVECVRCAIIIQQHMIGENLERPESEWIRFRIGINLGDVIFAGGDVYGDGVNIAARLEQLAAPGTIYISGGVYEQVRYKLVCGYQSLGERHLKNIQDPVPVYRVLPDPSAVVTVTKYNRWRLALLALPGIVLLTGGIGYYLWQRTPLQQPVSPTPPPTTAPSIQETQSLPIPPQSIPTPPQPIPVPATPIPKPPLQQQTMVQKPSPEPSRMNLPETVHITGGSFDMGSSEDPTEQPLHKVTVNTFVMGKDVVTVRQWRECVQAKACSYVPQGDGDQPLGNVSWNDTQQYLTWLSGVTNHQWRLPTEAEWEYAARAGTKTRFWWGDAMKPGMAMCKGCGVNPAKVAANPFGLYINDGVAEWVEDCWVKDYHGAPTNGSTRVVPGCSERVLRGASASNDQSYARPASRDFYDAMVRYPTHGFRIAGSL